MLPQVPPAWTVIESSTLEICSSVVDHLKTAVAVEMLPVIPADKLKSADPRKPKPKGKGKKGEEENNWSARGR